MLKEKSSLNQAAIPNYCFTNSGGDPRLVAVTHLTITEAIPKVDPVLGLPCQGARDIEIATLVTRNDFVA